MVVFTYDKTFEGLLTALFEAYYYKIFPDLLWAEQEPLSPLTTLTIKVLQVRHPKRNPFLGPFGCFPFPMLKQFAEEANYGGKYFRLPKKEKDNRQ